MIYLNLNPVIIKFGPLSIRWYSLAYIIGILFGLWYIRKVDKYKIFDHKKYDSLLSWVVLGIILGGRLGYIIFYNLDFYISFPVEIVKIWNGGMSFHGGALGLIISIVIFCNKYKIPLLYTLDLVCCAAPLGILLGRIANFINGELYGKITKVPWSVIFPTSNDFLPRHPSQLYEAVFEGLLLFIFLNILVFFTNIRQYAGMLSSIFLLWYAISRFIIEFFREPDPQIGYVIFEKITMGQLLSFPMLMIGIYILVKSTKNTNFKT